MTTTEHDYIIIGAGSAGCVLANKLSAGGDAVLVLEAGPMDRDLLIHIPAGVYSVYKDPKLNWNYLAEPQDNLFGRQVETPRGKVVGGSSSINSMVYMRGHPLDYDRWADELGLGQWRYADCLPYFKAGEASDRGGDDWRGGDGPLGVTKGGGVSPLYGAFVEAGTQAGQGRSEDLNGFKPEGVALLDATKRNGRRCSAAVAHLRPALGRANLTLKTRAMTQRVLLEAARAVGVEFMLGGARHTARARKEVILCGGAINSPQLLMLSGIGPAAHLAEHGIDVAHDLPGVGQNLMDHATVVMQWRSKKPLAFHGADQPLRKAMIGLRWLMTRKGLAASSIWEAGGLIRGGADQPYPNLQYHFGAVGAAYEGTRIKLMQAFSLHIDQLRPASRGEVRLRSADPAEKPALHFNYLSAGRDEAELIDGVRRARELVNARAFDEWRGEEITPGPAARTDAEIAEAIRREVSTDYHPCGTCRMGVGDDAVVDAELRVNGVDGLRVVDASILPRIISANLNAPTQMIAARAADYILGRAQRPAEHARFSFQEG